MLNSDDPLPSPDPVRASRLLTPRRLLALATVYLLVTLTVLIMLRTGYGILKEEVRTKARDLATLLSSQIDPAALAEIRDPSDTDKPAFRRILMQIRTVKDVYPDVRYIYIIRPDSVDQPTSWRFVIDAQPHDVDLNQDGTIQPSERGVLPGEPYEEAAGQPAIALALKRPAATSGYFRDEWGTYLSGFAPIREESTGRPIAVLGIDITQQTVRAKFFAGNVVAFLALIFLLGLVTVTIFALYGKAQALEIVGRLHERVGSQNDQLQEANRRLAATVAELTDRDRRMGRELRQAQEVQQRFLPRDYPFQDRLRCASFYRASRLIGGDLYDLLRVDDQTAIFMIADISGHGVSSALLTSALKMLIDRRSEALIRPVAGGSAALVSDRYHVDCLQAFMAEVNHSLAEILIPGQFITCLLGVIHLDQNRLLLANAGHPAPLWTHRPAAAEPMRVAPLELPSNLALGLVANWKFQVVAHPFKPGERLFLYTDGLVERRNGAGEEFGAERLEQAVAATTALPVDRAVGQVLQALEEFADGEEPHDDMAILLIERTEA
ncbi:MAG TPA: PP2C family protein-serine/threonine phosphatase [Candidatus Sumerlaeota bacterium]|nr:PP2C family protein-serine/threonine phosphatase [Candidatus Sumerlaeota bacterium]